MVRPTDADIDTTNWTTDRLATYINRTAPVAADLTDDDPAADVIRANVRAAIDAFRDRGDAGTHAVTDGGTDDTTDVSDIVDDDAWAAHVDDTDTTFKLRHDRRVTTEVTDGDIVHRVFESVDDDAAAESITHTRAAVQCPHDGHSATRDVSGDDNVERFDCPDCQFDAAVAYRPDSNTPSWYRATVPHAAASTDASFNPDDYDDADATAQAANITRHLAIDRYVSTVRDAAYVSPDYDDDGDKTADAYIDTTTCARCDDEVETPAVRTHAHFGDVCATCEDATVWSPADADIPDDVRARMSEHKTFSRTRIVRYLRDVAFWGDYVAAQSDDDVDADDTNIKTGRGGKRAVTAAGNGTKGTGLRRPKGAAHGDAHFRTTLSDLFDTGLIARTDARDTDVDDANAEWRITGKGRDVLTELARCETCGDTLSVFLRTSAYKVGRRTEHDTSLSIGCKACGDADGTTTGTLVIDTSSDVSYTKLTDI